MWRLLPQPAVVDCDAWWAQDEVDRAQFTRLFARHEEGNREIRVIKASHIRQIVPEFGLPLPADVRSAPPYLPQAHLRMTGATTAAADVRCRDAPDADR